MDDIKCPKCGFDFDDDDTYPFYGSDGPQETECPNCEALLIVTEHGTLLFTVTLAVEG